MGGIGISGDEHARMAVNVLRQMAEPLDDEAALDIGRVSDQAWAAIILRRVERLSQIETRAQQIRGGLKPYARPVEIVDYLMGEQA